MKFLDKDELNNLKKAPVKRPRTSRAKMQNVRDFETWFKKMKHFGGTCSNPDCCDPRPKSDYPTTMVATLPNGKTTCRFCFLAGYGLEETDEPGN